ELELLGGRRLRPRIAPGALAPHRPRCSPRTLHARILAPPALLVRLTRERRDVRGILAGALRRECRRRPRRARPRLRALRSPDAVRPPRPDAWDPRARRRHGGQEPASVLDRSAEQRGARRDDARDRRADAWHVRVSLEVPARCGVFHRRRRRALSLTASEAPARP